MKTPIGLLAACVMGTMFAVSAMAADQAPAATAPAATAQPGTASPTKPETKATRAAWCKEHKEDCAKKRAERHAKWCKAHPEKCKAKEEKKEEKKEDSAKPDQK